MLLILEIQVLYLEGTEDGILRFHNNLDLFKTSLFGKEMNIDLYQ